MGMSVWVFDLYHSFLWPLSFFSSCYRLREEVLSCKIELPRRARQQIISSHFTHNPALSALFLQKSGWLCRTKNCFRARSRVLLTISLWFFLWENVWFLRICRFKARERIKSLGIFSFKFSLEIIFQTNIYLLIIMNEVAIVASSRQLHH